MNKYIELNKVLNELGLDHKDYVYIDKHEVAERIKKLPSIDIVRCKECKYYKQSEAFCENGNGLWQAGDECFCNYGEREGE